MHELLPSRAPSMPKTLLVFKSSRIRVGSAKYLGPFGQAAPSAFQEALSSLVEIVSWRTAAYSRARVQG